MCALHLYFALNTMPWGLIRKRRIGIVSTFFCREFTKRLSPAGAKDARLYVSAVSDCFDAAPGHTETYHSGTKTSCRLWISGFPCHKRIESRTQITKRIFQC